MHLKRNLKYTEKAGVVASRLLHCYHYVRKYYSEHYIKDIQAYSLEN